MKKIKFLGIIITLVITFTFGIKNINAECYKLIENDKKTFFQDQPTHANVLAKQGKNITKVDDYYCSVNACASAVTESGNKPTTYINISGKEVGVKGCGGCGTDYAWDDNNNRCDLSSHAKDLNERATCAKNATNSVDCSKCQGYGWDSDNKTCVPLSTLETSCMSFTDEKSCITSSKFACLWNGDEKTGYCNTDNLVYVQCGGAFDIPSQIPQIVSFVVNLLKIAVPIVLILVSIITLFKALFASKEDEITKAKNSLIKKIIAAVMVFFIIQIVQFVVSKVADDRDAENISTCLKCFLNNECEGSAYYKTNVAGTYMCTNINSGVVEPCEGSK